jgi:pilus assembly protein CpaC
MACKRVRRLFGAVALLLCTHSAVGAEPTSPTDGNTSRSDAAAQTLRLEVGEQRLISAEGVRSYSEGVAGIVDVRLTDDGQQFVVVALKPGRTTLLILRRNGQNALYRVEVREPAEVKPPTPSPDSVAVKDNIRLDFYFVQLEHDYAHQLGVAWPNRVGGGTVSADFALGGLQSLTGVVNQALPSLDLAQGSGWAKVMRHATVVTANGTEARYGGGGEVNLAVQSQFASGIHRIEYGSIIGVLPRYDRSSGRIELSVNAELSDLRATATSPLPGRTTSELKTVVNLALGQSLVLAGLNAESEGAAKSGLPGLSQIPLLGVFFGSHSQRRERTQQLVVIVPTVTEAVDAHARQELLRALKIYRNFAGGSAELRRETPTHQADL